MSDDTISRQAAIEQAVKQSQVDGAYGYMDTKSIIDMLNDLPSADRKKGIWTVNAPGDTVYKYRCSECGAYHRALYDYCPSCGAEMSERGEDNAEVH